MINYNGKIFKPTSNTENGETSSETIFHYIQVDNQGNIEICYHQVNDKDELMKEVCQSKPEILENVKIRLHENWELTSG
jgi:hypothetical protein